MEYVLDFEPINFIAAWYLEDNSICDDLVKYWQDSDNKYPGVLGGKDVNPSAKDSVDVTIPAKNPPPVIKNYIDQLSIIIEKYKQKYKWAGASTFGLVEPVNIQFYKPGGGFKIWHTERTDSAWPSIARHLVFMTYLNDLDNGGTEFYFQKLKVPAKKGLTVVWPADWTHTHRGVISNTQDKYIITGWLNLV